MKFSSVQRNVRVFRAAMRVYRAYTVPGRVPTYHFDAVKRLNVEWPALAEALKELKSAVDD